MKQFLKNLTAFLIVGLMGSCGTYEAIYHIPKTSVHVKLVSYFNEADGYIFINDRPAFEKQDKPACLLVHKSDVSMTYIIFKRDEVDSILYIRNASDNAQIVDSGRFSIKFVELGDSTITQPHSKIENAFMVKPDYYDICIDGFLNSVRLFSVDSAGIPTSMLIPELECPHPEL